MFAIAAAKTAGWIASDCVRSRSTRLTPRTSASRVIGAISMLAIVDAAGTVAPPASKISAMLFRAHPPPSALKKGCRRTSGAAQTPSRIQYQSGRASPIVFSTDTPQGGGIPSLTLSTIAGPFCLGSLEILPVPLMHGTLPILGFRIGSFAYLTDCSAIPDESWPMLTGVRTLVLDALRERPHPTHFSVTEAVEAAQRIGAERTYFTHICHDLPHAETCARLPPGIELAYDGQVLTITD